MANDSLCHLLDFQALSVDSARTAFFAWFAKLTASCQSAECAASASSREISRCTLMTSTPLLQLLQSNKFSSRRLCGGKGRLHRAVRTCLNRCEFEAGHLQLLIGTALVACTSRTPLQNEGPKPSNSWLVNCGLSRPDADVPARLNSVNSSHWHEHAGRCLFFVHIV